MGRNKEKSGNVTLVQTKKVINVEHQLLVAERDDLLEAELGYKRRIEQLEKENKDTLNSFDILYNENKILRSKLDTPDGVGADSIESYNSVYKDREHLREANRAFKRRIHQLEDDAAEAQKSYNQLYQKHQLVTQKAQLETEFATKTRDEKINEMEKEHEEISSKLKMFLKEREQYEYRISEMDKERNELQNKYDFLLEEKHEFQIRCDVLQADRENLKQKVSDLQEKVPDPEVKAKEEQQFLSLQAQVVALQVSNTDASKEIHKLKEEIRVLSKQRRAKVEMVDRASSVIVDDEEEENERQKEERYAEVEAELVESRQRAINLLKENDRLKTDTADLESKVANLELNIDEIQKELKFKKEEVEDLSVLAQSGQSLNEDYLALQEKLKDLSATRQALENELIQEKKMSKLKVMELSKELEKIKDKLNETEKDKMKSDGENKKLQNENDTLLKVNEAQASELRNMKAQLEQVQNILEDKTEKYQEMKKTEKENQEELRECRLQLHIAQRELEDLRKEKAGNFNTLKHEMQTAKDERKEETEQMRQETLRLRAEVKKLKDYEHKITTMDSEIRRLMNRVRMSDRLKKLPPKQTKGEGEKDEKDEIKELKRRQRELEKEKMIHLQERRQWEILKEKYADLQLNNRRLVEENKRVRGDLDGTNFKVDSLEKKFKKLHINVDDNANGPKPIQRATYVENPEKRSSRFAAKKRETKLTEIKDKKKSDLKSVEEPRASKQVFAGTAPLVRKIQMTQLKERRKFERKSTRTAEDMSKMRSKKPVLPKLGPKQEAEPGLMFGKGYRELHKSRYKPSSSLELL